MKRIGYLGHQYLRRIVAGIALATLASLAAAQTGPPTVGLPTVNERSVETTIVDTTSAEVNDSGKEALALSLLQYQQAIAGKLYDEAADAGKVYISTLLKDPDHDPKEWSHALSRLGHAQQQSGQIDAAVENYTLAVEVIELESDRLDNRLAYPLQGLSRALADAGDYRAAVSSYKRLLHIQQVNNGLHTLKQAKTVSELSELYYRLGDFRRANALQQSYVSIYSQNYPGDNLQKLPALYSQANMYARTDHLIDSQRSFHKLIAMIEREDGAKSLYLLSAIYQFADLLQNNHINDGDDGIYRARRFLRRAVYIAENHEDATNLDRADAYIAMGDFLSLETFDRRAAMRHYVAAWEQLSADPTLAAEREIRFGNPTVLNAMPPHSATSMRKLLMLSVMSDNELLGRLAVQYSIGPDGRTRDFQVLEGDPTGYWDPVVINHIDSLIFRPGIVDGEPSEYANNVYEIQYSIRDQELPGEFRQNGLSNKASYQTQ
jgi:Tetratricopeptide repeat